MPYLMFPVVGLVDAEVERLNGANFAKPRFGLVPVYNFPSPQAKNSFVPAIHVNGVWLQVNPVRPTPVATSPAQADLQQKLERLEATNATLTQQLAACREELATKTSDLATKTEEAVSLRAEVAWWKPRASQADLLLQEQVKMNETIERLKRELAIAKIERDKSQDARKKSDESSKVLKDEIVALKRSSVSIASINVTNPSSQNSWTPGQASTVRPTPAKQSAPVVLPSPSPSPPVPTQPVQVQPQQPASPPITTRQSASFRMLEKQLSGASSKATASVPSSVSSPHLSYDHQNAKKSQAAPVQTSQRGYANSIPTPVTPVVAPSAISQSSNINTAYTSPSPKPTTTATQTVTPVPAPVPSVAQNHVSAPQPEPIIAEDPNLVPVGPPVDDDNQDGLAFLKTPGEGYGEIFVALQDFQAEDFRETDFMNGDEVMIINKMDEVWWVGRVNRTGRIGQMPANHLTPKS